MKGLLAAALFVLEAVGCKKSLTDWQEGFVFTSFKTEALQNCSDFTSSKFRWVSGLVCKIKPWSCEHDGCYGKWSHSFRLRTRSMLCTLNVPFAWTYSTEEVNRELAWDVPGAVPSFRYNLFRPACLDYPSPHKDIPDFHCILNFLSLDGGTATFKAYEQSYMISKACMSCFACFFTLESVKLQHPRCGCIMHQDPHS